MRVDCVHLSLAPDWAGANDHGDIAVVRAVDGLRLVQSGGHEVVEVSEVLWELERVGRSLAWEIGQFTTRAVIGGFEAKRLSDDERIAWVARALRRGAIVGIRRRADGGEGDDKVLAQRRLARQIAAATARQPLSTGGRRYKLVPGPDLAHMADRDRYEVVPRAEALRVLGELESEVTPALAALIARARQGLTADWRPPLSPEGLVLLRRGREAHAAGSGEPALTPSQLWGKAAKEDDDIIDWIIWIELDPLDPKAEDDVVILLDQFYQEVMRKPLASCPREETGVLVTFEQIHKHDRFTLIRDYGPNEGGGQDTLFIDSTPAELDEIGKKAS